MTDFYVVYCTKCGYWSVQSTNKRFLDAKFKCKYECKGTVCFKDKRRYGSNVRYEGKFLRGTDAAKRCAKLNGKL